MQRTTAANSYRLERPGNFNFRAGQYMFVDLGDNLVHPLSLSDCPEESVFLEFTKRMTGSDYCQRLESLKKGDVVSVKGPEGKFTLKDDADGDYIFLAGGIGITPLRSILKSYEKQKKDCCRITLIYGNNDKDDIAFKDELENLKIAHFKLVNVLSDNTGMEEADKGFITADIIGRESAQFTGVKYFISGPPAMVKGMHKELGKLHVSDDDIQTDLFAGYD